MKKRLIMLLVLCALMMFVDGRFVPFFLPFVFAHCDTLDGPVAKTALHCLETGDVTPILKWVKKKDEAEVIGIFKKTLSVRGKGKEAKEIADRYFLETVVRLHRAGEGEPYTGLKPAGFVEPAIVEADRALESGSAARLVKLVVDAASKGVRDRFKMAKETKTHADESVEAGREYVEAYVQFTHYVERLHLDATESKKHHGTHKELPTEKHLGH